MIPNISSILNSTADPKDPKAVAAKVQAMFTEVMIKAMEDSVGAEDGIYSNSSTAEIYRGMFREQLGATLGGQVGSSLLDELEREMKKSQSNIQNNSESKVSSVAAAAAPAGNALPETADLNELPIGKMPAGAGARAGANVAEGLPVAGVVTSEVGWRKDPITGNRAFHKGTDIAAPLGTSIRAVASGVVVESGVKGEYGNAVVVKTDDGRRMLYGHNSANFVRVGDRVEQGETIAAVGATGRATGPHVHFEVSE